MMPDWSKPAGWIKRREPVSSKKRLRVFVRSFTQGTVLHISGKQTEQQRRRPSSALFCITISKPNQSKAKPAILSISICMTPPVNNLPTMKTALLLLAATVETTLGFSSLPQAKMSTELKSDKAGDPFRLVDVDIEHAKDCADHFGMCSTKELKQIKEDLHRKRIQDLVLGENAPEDVLSTKMIEEEISLQLNLLQNEMPPSTLFPPEDESPMAELPHKNESVELAEKVKHEEQVFWLEVLEEEGVLDSLAICALIGFLMFAPQLL